MKQGLRVFWFFSYVLAVLSLPASGLAAGSEKRFALPEHGFLQLSVPSGWTDQFDQNSKLPQISFRQSQGQPFIVSVNPAWQTAAGKSALPRQELRTEVEEMASAIHMFSVEQDDIKIDEFAGAAGPGFYFFATDASPGPGGYKFMNRGMLKVGDLLVTFTILTNEGQDGIVRAALEMLKSAVHVPR
jgi:hypothetical protein